MASSALDSSANPTPSSRRNVLRFVTAASLFDGHDASINIMRRVLQSEGVEVVHLGHDRAVADVVTAAIEEDAHAIAVSSYQGGHNEYFAYMVELLRERGRGDIQVFGGGGGTITDAEIRALHEKGVAKLYSVEDGRKLGLVGMIRDMIARADRVLQVGEIPAGAWERNAPDVARALSSVEALNGAVTSDDAAESSAAITALNTLRGTLADAISAADSVPPIVGITGTGGAGKSSMTDEIVRRFLLQFPERTVAILSVDPSRRRTGGALLGDRIRMNAVSSDRVFMRSMATRRANTSVSGAVKDALTVLQAVGYDLVILETAGIGQSGSEVVDLCNLSLYVMTPEFGAPSQLEKIDMLDFADLVAINKADKRGADDARRHVSKQVQRNRGAFQTDTNDMPVYLCSASHYGDPGLDRIFVAICEGLQERSLGAWDVSGFASRAPELPGLLPPNRTRYLAEIAESVRGYKETGRKQRQIAATADALRTSVEALGGALPDIAEPFDAAALESDDPAIAAVAKRYNAALEALSPQALALLREIPELRSSYTAEQNVYSVRGREFRVDNYTTTLTGTQVPKVALPTTDSWADWLRWRWEENVPGQFPFTAGVFPYKRSGEDPTRMFAGEGGPEQTNLRFHYLAKDHPAARLSTAFDSVTLYGRDPDLRPDIWGKVGNSGVSVATLDDIKRLYSGFDLVAPTTSVSMTINGPAPMILAMFLNAAIDQAVERRLKDTGRWEDVVASLGERPVYRAESLPPGHDGSGLGLLGVTGDQVVSAEEYAEIKATVLKSVRGTVQADILKEDQAQNTCIFSTDFALKMQGDLQEFFVQEDIRNFYSVSISGYHIAEAGANPVTQLAFTLANGFTFAEYFRARGMDVDAFARNLSFFFSNGIDPEYSVIGRVARRIWAIAMRDVYGANERSQKLKYHIQTSGRSLHAQEIDFNDIRTTLQAFYAIADNCNSLHTNAFDEAITTPTEASVRRAVAIQLILNHEFGMLTNENPLQGAFFVDYMTEAVEEAVLDEFVRLSDRGGVLGAMELMYQRSKIQEESMHYESRKHSGELPIIGVNTFLNPNAESGVVEVDMIRADEVSKRGQIAGRDEFHRRNADRSGPALDELERIALAGGNVFEALMETVKVCSLGQITERLFRVGGQYRRNV